MKVKRDSWHFQLVEHKRFLSELKDSNDDAMAYLCEVYVAIFCRTIIPLLLLVTIPGLLLAENGQLKEHFWVCADFIIVVSPIWITVVSIFIEPMTSKKWRKLEIV